MSTLLTTLLSALVLVSGAFFTGYLRLFPWRYGGLIRREVRASLRAGASGGFTPMQSVCTALSATVGTGNVAGVAVALTLGGAGSVFWMWIAALLGMSTGFAENVLGVRYREQTADGCLGGSMYPIARGLHRPRLAALMAIACCFSALGVGCIVQASSITGILRSAFGLSPRPVSLLLALSAGVVFLGGAKRIGRVTEILIPVMLILYVSAALLCLCMRLSALPRAIARIFAEALSPEAFLGGGAWAAIRQGVSRGVFSNEAGLGTSAFAHASAPDATPIGQGCASVAETAVDTLLICTLTALVILTSGAAQGSGAALTASAFAVSLGRAGEIVVAGCLALFAFSTILGWGHFGAVAARFCFGPRGVRVLHALMLAAIAFSGRVSLEAVWLLADLCSLLTAAPNLLCCFLLRREVLTELQSASEHRAQQLPQGLAHRPRRVRERRQI